MFASTELAARIERAECGLLTDACAVAAGRLGDGVFVTPLAGGVATCTEPGSPLNKVAGLGFGGVPDDEDLAAVEAAYDTRGVPVQMEVSTLGDPAVVRELSERGYVLTGFENVSGRELPAGSDAATGGREGRDGEVRVEEIPAGEMSGAVADRWLDIFLVGFATPDDQGVPSHETFEREVLEGILQDTLGASGVRRYMAYRSGEPAGAAAMRLDGGVAQLMGAATLPAHRRRGVQTALLHGRLGEAARRGCDLAVVTTQPGSKSLQNVQRLGFHLLYARAVMIRRLSVRGALEARKTAA
jgi:GNAT superfamily N-acetyltransferase